MEAPLCTECGKRFTSRQAYAGHYRIHVADLRRAAAAASPENADLQEPPENVLIMMPRRAKLPESDIASSSTEPAKPELSAPCRFCKKRFSSARALAGHMRWHPERECRGINSPTESPNSTGSFEDFPAKRKPSAPCRVCEKIFPSAMALNGHMRCHPEREWRGISPPTESPSSAGSCEDFPVSWSRKGRRGQLPSSFINAVEALLELSHNVRGEIIRVSEKKRSSGESTPQTLQLLEDCSAPKQINSITITEAAAGNRNVDAAEALRELSHNVRGEIVRVSEKKRSSGESTPPTLQLLEDLSVPKQINSITITEAAAGNRNLDNLEKKRRSESGANYASDSGISYAQFNNKKLKIKIKNTVESLKNLEYSNVVHRTRLATQRGVTEGASTSVGVRF